jgi:molecular chaperone GrpE
MPEGNKINNENNEIKPVEAAPKDSDSVSQSGEVANQSEMVEQLRAELEKSVRERDEYLDGWKRVKADFINYKKEESSRLGEIIRFSNEDLIRDIIPVLDSFELGLASLEKVGQADKGIYMIKGQLEDILRHRGLEKIKVVPGEVFNPRYHESVGVVEVKDTSLVSGTVAEEVETGYVYQGKVLRPARVRLVK